MERGAEVLVRGLRARTEVRRRFPVVLGHLGLDLGTGDPVDPLVRTVNVRGFCRDHPVVRPRGGTFLRDDRVHLGGCRVRLHTVGGDLPRGPEDQAGLREALLLLQVVTPVLADVRLLLLEQRDRGSELRVVERVRVGDLQLGLRLGEVQRSVRDVDRRVVRGDLAFVRRVRLEDHAPAVRRGCDCGLVEHEEVGAPTVRHAVHLAVHAVPRLGLQERREFAVGGDLRGVDNRGITVGNAAQRRVAGRGHDVVLAGVEELECLVRGTERLDRRLASGLGLERRHPVDVLRRRPVLRVPGPREDRHRATRRLAARGLLPCGRSAAAATRGEHEHADRAERAPT